MLEGERILAKTRSVSIAFTDNEMYTLAQNSSDWGCLAVGKTSYSGQILDRDTFEKLKADCTEEGTFELD